MYFQIEFSLKRFSFTLLQVQQPHFSLRFGHSFRMLFIMNCVVPEVITSILGQLEMQSETAQLHDFKLLIGQLPLSLQFLSFFWLCLCPPSLILNAISIVQDFSTYFFRSWHCFFIYEIYEETELISCMYFSSVLQPFAVKEGCCLAGWPLVYCLWNFSKAELYLVLMVLTRNIHTNWGPAMCLVQRDVTGHISNGIIHCGIISISFQSSNLL